MILGVFVPSLMGAGILVSGAILLVDVLRRYLPQSGLHRRHRVAIGAFNVVAGAAAWAGREVAAGELLDLTVVPQQEQAFVVELSERELGLPGDGSLAVAALVICGQMRFLNNLVYILFTVQGPTYQTCQHHDYH